MDEFISIREAARILGVTPARIHALGACDKLGQIRKDGRRWLIPKAAVLARRDAMKKIRAIQNRLDELTEASLRQQPAGQGTQAGNGTCPPKDRKATRLNKFFASVVISLAAFLLVPPRARAQSGIHFTDIAISSQNGGYLHPVPNATVTVCTTQQAAPCTISSAYLATLYTDGTLTTKASNPVYADSNGNFGFWGAPGTYLITVSGTGVAAYSYTRTLGQPGAAIVSTPNNGQPGAVEPKSSDAVIYVSPNGNDSADGLSWGSAKQTLYAAVSAVENATVGGGTIYVAANTACGGPVSGQGLWLIGDNDSAHTSPPSGWIYAEWPLRIIGVGTTTWYGNASGSAVNLNCGSGTTANEPGLWLSGTNRPFYFANLYFPLNDSSGLRLGIDTTGSRSNNNSGANSVVFDNVQFGAAINGTAGPAVDIGNNVFWVWFRHSTFNADTSATALSDAHQAVVINPGPSGSCGHQDGLLTFEHNVANGGGVHFFGSCENGGSLYVKDLTTESENDGSPAVWISTTAGNMSSGAYRINDVGVSDATVNPTYAVKVDNTSTVGNPASDSTVVSNVGGSGQNVSGPMTVLSQYSMNLQNGTTDPYLGPATGFIADRVYAQVDAARRMFSPTAYPWPNLVNQVPSSWSLQTMTPGATTTTGPDGANQALDANNSTGASSSSVTFMNTGGLSASSGDYFVFGFWWRLVSGSYYAGTAGIVSISCGSGGATDFIAGQGQYFRPPFGGNSAADNEWQWGWTVVKAVTVVGGVCGFSMAGPVNNNAHMQFFDPVIIHIPAGQVTDNEAAEFGANLANYPDGLTPPVEASPRGLPFAFGGSGDNYFAILDHTTLAANQTYSFPSVGGQLLASVYVGTVSGPTAAISSGACATTITTPVPDATTSSTILATPNADPAAANYKALTVYWFPTAGNINLEVCNPSAASVTPTALTFNVTVIE
jgi:hypothetical protein